MGLMTAIISIRHGKSHGKGRWKMKCKLGASRDLWDVGFRVMLLVGAQQELKISGFVKASCLIFVQQYFLFPVASIHKRTSGAEKVGHSG